MTDCFGYCIIPLLNEFSLAVINGCGQSTINYYVNLLQIVSFGGSLGRSCCAVSCCCALCRSIVAVSACC